MMAVTHTNRRGQIYYLHQGRTNTGKPRFFFSQKAEGDLAEAIPEGYEIYEKSSAQVFLRRAVPSRITGEEVEAVKQGLCQAGVRHFLVEKEANAVVVHTPSQSESELRDFTEKLGGGLLGGLFGNRLAAWREDQLRTGNYTAMMRFVLADEGRRLFSAQRWCFRGSIDSWIAIGGRPAGLADLVRRYAPHLEKESFFDLM
jgi:hypothetical protein